MLLKIWTRARARFTALAQTRDLGKEAEGFPGGTVVKNLPANAGDMVLSPGPGSSHMPRSN